MPRFLHTVLPDRNLLLDTTEGTALLDGRLFHQPCTREVGEHGAYFAPIPPGRFGALDLSQLYRAETVANGQMLAVEPAGWNAFFMRAAP